VRPPEGRVLLVDAKQVGRLMKELAEGETLERAALKSGMSEVTARRYRKGATRKGSRPARSYRTRTDPFESVWPEIAAMMECAPGLEAKTILERLCERPDRSFHPGQLRTLQRRLRSWRAQHGPEKEVFFPQEHRAGEYAQSDFTSMNDLGITIDGEPFEHLIYHFVLPYSRWETGMICFSETFEALIAGFQRSVEELGRVPHRHRTDNLSAATHDLKDGRRAFNERYLGAMAHYGVVADRNTPGRANENGSVEQAHHRFKRAVEQALLVRGTRDFADRTAYDAFLSSVGGEAQLLHCRKVWPHRCTDLGALAEVEASERNERRTARRLEESKLPREKTLGSYDQTRLPAKVRTLLATLRDGSFLDRAINVIAFGNPGTGKTHLVAALGHELVRQNRTVFFTPTFTLVQRLLAAKRDLKLAQELRKLDRFEALILDDIGYVQQSREEMEVLFTLLAERYERRSVVITSNLVFSKWDQIFKDTMTTAAAIDRVVHHSVILELTNASYRAETAKRRAGVAS